MNKTWLRTKDRGFYLWLYCCPFATKLNLVSMTSWVSLLDNFTLTANLVDAPTWVAATPSGWASR